MFELNEVGCDRRDESLFDLIGDVVMVADKFNSDNGLIVYHNTIKRIQTRRIHQDN